MKALVPVCKERRNLPPGHYPGARMASKTVVQTDWMEYGAVEAQRRRQGPSSRPLWKRQIKRQLMVRRAYGVLLSGGLDSSVISAITSSTPPAGLERRQERPVAALLRRRSGRLPDLAAAPQGGRSPGHHPPPRSTSRCRRAGCLRGRHLSPSRPMTSPTILPPPCT